MLPKDAILVNRRYGAINYMLFRKEQETDVKSLHRSADEDVASGEAC